MTIEQVNLIRSTWMRIEPMAEKAGQAFYRKLFACDPDLRALFNTDMNIQANKLVQVIDFLVKNIDRQDIFQQEVNALGERHLNYGARPLHYELIGVCLIETLQDCMPGEWTPEMTDAWTTAYYRIKQVMIVARPPA